MHASKSVIRRFKTLSAAGVPDIGSGPGTAPAASWGCLAKDYWVCCLRKSCFPQKWVADSDDVDWSENLCYTCISRNFYGRFVYHVERENGTGAPGEVSGAVKRREIIAW